MYQNKSRFAKVLGIASTVFLVIYTIFSVFPLIWMVIISFKSDVDMFKTLFIFKPTLDNFRNVLTTGNYVKAFGDNFIICSGAVLVSVIVGVPAAYAWQDIILSGKRLWRLRYFRLSSRLRFLS